MRPRKAKNTLITAAIGALWFVNPVAQTNALSSRAGPHPIRGAHYPALSPDGKKLCFEYVGDLWTVESEGGIASRLTVHAAYDAYPHWSPDGRWIAFSSNRRGNFDVYLIPSKGGESRQITVNSADDIVQDWSPDGSQILFSSARDSRYADLYTVSVRDGRLRRITNDKSASRYASFTPDGMTILYTRGRQEWWRPRYKGSANAEIYSLSLTDGKTRRLTNYDGFDAWPLPFADGRSMFFVSDRSGTANLCKMTLMGANAVQVTSHISDAVRFPTIARNGSRIAYEREFEIWTLNVANPGTSSSGAQRPLDNFEHPIPIRIFAYSDAKENVVQRVSANAGAASFSLSQDGKSLALALRGKLWTCPAEGGDASQVTRGVAAEYSPIWSSDGSSLAYTTDRNGNLDVYLVDLKTRTEVPVTSDPSDDQNPEFSPDGRLLSFVRRGGGDPGLYVLPTPKIGSDAPKVPSVVNLVGAGTGLGSYEWSPDGRWLAYSRRDPTGTTDIWIVPAVGGTPVNVTRYPGANSSPHWTRDGRRLVFLSSRGGDGSFQSMTLYSLELLPRPARDDELSTGAPGAPVDEDAGQRRRPPDTPIQNPLLPSGPLAQGLGGSALRATIVRIEFDDIHNRAKPVGSSRESIGSFSLAPDARTAMCVMTTGGTQAWWAIDLITGAMNRVAGGGDTGTGVQFAQDGSGFFFLGPSGAVFRLGRGTPAPVRVAFTALMEVDRRREMAEAFNEAWRHLRTEFYDPKMHGTDWQNLRMKYEPVLNEITAKEDFVWLLSAMIGELNASHLGVTSAADPGASVATAHLGLTFDQEYSGPGLKVKSVMPKGPADQLGHHIQAGEYIMAIDGENVAFNESMYRALQDKVDKNVDALVNGKPVKEGAHAVKLKAISKAALEDLEYERWVASRREKVDALSGGRLAYIHIRAMDQPSLRKFQRELFGDAQAKEGLVLDVRFNGGGRIHDDLFALLLRKPHVFEVPRDSERSSQPFQVWNRPTTLLINEGSASDAEIFPNGFREYGLGKLVGVPTYGGVIGTTNITLIDGTTFRIPRTGWYTPGGRNLENYGVPPDIRVEMSPEDYATDNDRQLEAAVNTVLAQLPAHRL